MKRFAVLLALVVLVAAAWSGGWFFAAGEIRRSVAALGMNDGETGPKVTCDALTVTGFPSRFDIECREATIVSGDVTTTLAGIKASVLVYNPTHAKFSALGPVALSDAFSGAQSRVEFRGAEGSARLEAADLWKGVLGEGWRIGRVSIVADDIVWTDTLAGELEVMRATHGEAHLVDIPERHDPAAGRSALAAYATLTDAEASGLGITGGEASIEAELTGLPNDLRRFSEESVAGWQAAGGQLNLVSLKGTAGEEYIESSGTIALDSGSRVDGQIKLKSRGLVERLGSALSPEWQRILLGAQAEDGSYSQTITIKAGVVFTGLIPVSIIPPLDQLAAGDG
jgi:hypothetical protein